MAERKPISEVGRSFKSFVNMVPKGKLYERVSQLFMEPDQEKIESMIKVNIAKLSKESILPAGRKEFIDFVIDAVKEIDPELTNKANSLQGMIQYLPTIGADGNVLDNWIIRMKAGEEVKIINGPQGTAIYRLEKIATNIVRTPEEEATVLFCRLENESTYLEDGPDGPGHYLIEKGEQPENITPKNILKWKAVPYLKRIEELKNGFEIINVYGNDDPYFNSLVWIENESNEQG